MKVEPITITVKLDDQASEALRELDARIRKLELNWIALQRTAIRASRALPAAHLRGEE